MSLRYALYQSRALIGADPKIHDDILEISITNNRKNNVTGFLHREGEYFVQYLEAEKDILEDTLDRIAKDDRHTDFAVIDEGNLRRRTLPDWQMGFVDGDQLSFADLLEVSDGALNF